MPAYSDGRPAFAGDFIKGRPHQAAADVVGELLWLADDGTLVVAYLHISTVPVEREAPGETYFQPTLNKRPAPYKFLITGNYSLGYTKDFHLIP